MIKTREYVSIVCESLEGFADAELPSPIEEIVEPGPAIHSLLPFSVER